MDNECTDSNTNYGAIFALAIQAAYSDVQTLITSGVIATPASQVVLGGAIQLAIKANLTQAILDCNNDNSSVNTAQYSNDVILKDNRDGIADHITYTAINAQNIASLCP